MQTALRLARWAFAIGSWFLAVGLMIMAMRLDASGHTAGAVLMGAAMAANGALLVFRA